MSYVDHRSMWETWKDNFLTFAQLDEGAIKQHPGVSIADFTMEMQVHQATSTTGAVDENVRRVARRDWKENRLACMRGVAFLKVATQGSIRLNQIVKRAAEEHPIPVSKPAEGGVMPNPTFHAWTALKRVFTDNLTDRAAELRAMIETQPPVTTNDDVVMVLDRMDKAKILLDQAGQPITDAHFFVKLETMFPFAKMEIVAIKRNPGDYHKKIADLRSHLRQAKSIQASTESAKRAFGGADYKRHQDGTTCGFCGGNHHSSNCTHPDSHNMRRKRSEHGSRRSRPRHGRERRHFQNDRRNARDKGSRPTGKPQRPFKSRPHKARYSFQKVMDKMPELSKEDFAHADAHDKINAFKGYLARFVEAEKEHQTEGSAQGDSASSGDDSSRSSSQGSSPDSHLSRTRDGNFW